MFKFVGENFALKLISLVAAVVMWMYVSAERFPSTTVTRMINAEVVRVGAPPTDVIVRPRQDSIQVEISGPKAEVEGLADNEIKAEIDVHGAHPNMTRLPVVSFRRPQNAQDVSVSPQAKKTVPVEIVARERKQLPITPVINAALVAGSRYGIPKLTPQFATIIGSTDDLKRVTRVVVLIDTNGLAVIADLPLKAQDKDGVEVTSVDLDPGATHVELAQPELPATRTLPVNVMLKGSPASPFVVSAVSAEPAEVTVVGRGEQLVQMTNVPTAEVSLAGLSGDLSRDVNLQLPNGVVLKNGHATVRVTVRVRDASRAGG